MIRKKLNLNKFDWDSREQKEGCLSLLRWSKEKKLKINLTPQDLFAIQKGVDTHEYWRDMVGTQIAMLQNEIKNLKEENIRLKNDILTVGNGLTIYKTIMQSLVKLMYGKRINKN